MADERMINFGLGLGKTVFLFGNENGPIVV
jgi:hypothetical protein